MKTDAPPPELVLTLDKPVTLGELSFSSVILREPTAGEWMLWDKLSGIEADIMAVSVVSGIPEPVVRKLPASKLLQASRYLAGFLA